MKTNRILKSLLILSLLAVMSITSYSQSIFNADIRETIELWEEFNDGVSLGDGAAPWGQIELPTGFQFRYGSSNMLVTDIYVYGNGFLSFNVFRNPSDLFVPYFAEYPNMISWYGRNLFTNGDLSYKLEGSAPFRVLTIQHTGARHYLDFSGREFDAQIKIFETTNEIQIIYGNVAAFGGANVGGYLYFTDNNQVPATNPRRYHYVNIEPTFVGTSNLYKSNSVVNVNPYLLREKRQFFPEGRAFTYSQQPTLAGISPINNLFANGDIIGDDIDENGRPFITVNRSPGQSEIEYRYSIFGPIGDPNASVIYEAYADGSDWIDPNPQPLGTNFKIEVTEAQGIAAGLNGILDLTDASILGGQYRVSVQLRVKNSGVVQSNTTFFTIAEQRDIAIVDVEQPVQWFQIIYREGNDIPVTFRVQNQGVNPVDEFEMKYTISGVDNSVFDQETFLVELDEPLEFREEIVLSMPNFPDALSGDYKFVLEARLTSVLEDDIPANNIFPRENAPDYLFRVAKEFDGSIAEIINPPSSMSAEEPTVPLVRLRNDGISPITNASMRMVITNPDGDEVYDETVTVEEIPVGLANTVEIDFPRTFVPFKTGSYSVDVNVTQTGDNASLTKSVSVVSGLAGIYTISANDGDFASITEAVEAMYDRGVSDDVTFLLSDGEYTEGNLALDEPALDLSSKIIGLGDEGVTVSFKPDEAVLLGNQVNIYLFSGAGIGVKIGNSTVHPYPDAPVNNVHPTDKNDFSVNDGHIIFDGGNRNAFNFALITESDSRAVFYLTEGAKNIQIKNVNIRGEVDYNETIYPPSYACYIPRTRYNASTLSYEYQGLSNNNGDISAGILIRATEPKFANTNANVFDVPVEDAYNNVIMNNEISDFGYGIVTLGMGSLFDEEQNIFVARYNHNNKIEGNRIYDVSKAGIFAGFESNSDIMYNEVFNVNGTCGPEAAGIILGATDDIDNLSGNRWIGYGNTELNIHGNEISFISASEDLYGIKLEQRQVELNDRDQTIIYPENMNIRIASNIVRDLRPANSMTNVIGVGVYPALALNTDIDWGMIEDVEYFRGDTFINGLWAGNNTIWMNNDEFENEGAFAGFALFNLEDSYFFNNAIAIADNNISPDAPEASAFIYRGVHPNSQALWSDRNVYWISNRNLVSTFRFIEIDDANDILEVGFKDEFRDLDQWQYWTGQDHHSVFGNFTNDLEYTGTNPFELRVKTEPLPKGSLLNNRGIDEDILRENSEFMTYDIDGVLRGKAGERYDVGAQEFNGRMSGRDLEILRVEQPGTYKATSPRQFSDAEYVMVTEEKGAEITTLIRNNSSIIVSGATVTARVYREDNTGNWLPVDEFTGEVNDLFQAESKVVNFTESFNPQPYSEFPEGAYSVPEAYEFLTTNVTPLYKFEFELEDDEYNWNNKVEKVVRFYVKRSRLNIVISSEFTSFNDVPDYDAFPLYYAASNMNLDTLIAGMADLAWFYKPSTEGDVDYDIFDRAVWEPRSVDYTLYKFLIWSDGHDQLPSGDDYVIGRYARDHIREFLESGTPTFKKHLVVGSQDMVRMNQMNGLEEFNENVLRTNYLAPGNPMDVDGNYSDKTVTGVNIARDVKLMIDSTRYENDDYPKAALVTPAVNEGGVGTTKAAFRYDSHFDDDPPRFAPEEERIMGVVSQSISQNVIYFGLDWRHWMDIESAMRALFDYLFANDVVPVELAGFEAEQAGSRVDISWKTASEENSSHFDVERADVANGNQGLFTSIDQIPAAGNSATFKYYNTSDNKVEFGNTYAYRLKSVDQDGTFDYSDVKYVTVTGALGAFTVGNAIPNPAQFETSFEYTLGSPMNVVIDLYDAQGAKVANVANEMKQAGTYSQSVDVQNLSAGTYTLIIKVGADVVTKQINVVR